MKKCMYYVLCVILLATVFVLTSCSNEDFGPQEEIANEEALEATSETMKLMQRTVDNDGSYDNIIDNSSCFDIRFPYTVSVNGLELTIDSMEDLELVETIFDTFETDEDILTIIFPITVTLADYTEVTLNSTTDLRELAAQCTEGGGDADIECIDFLYPITMYTFNPNLVRTGTVTVESDNELRRFFSGINESDLVSVAFPVSFELHEGTKLTVNNNAELSAAITAAIDTCDEDDDNDYNDDDFTQERLNALLVECPWLVKELERNDQDNSEQYQNYVLNFGADGGVVARDRNGNMLDGEWSTRVSDYRVLLNIEFEFLADFTLEWFVHDIDGEKIKLFAGDGDKIIMKVYCEDAPVACSENFIATVLNDCRWAPSQGEPSFLDDFRIDFSNRNIHVYDAQGAVVDEGNWEINANVLTFNDLSMELANYIGAWEVVECSDVRFVLQRGGETLVIEKECIEAQVACEEEFIEETLSTCEWQPSQGENSFLNYLKIDFSDKNIHVRNPNGTIVDEGNWSIEGSVVTFNNLSMELANYVGEWQVTECSSSRFRLERSEEVLIIEKECD